MGGMSQAATILKRTAAAFSEEGEECTGILEEGVNKKNKKTDQPVNIVNVNEEHQHFGDLLPPPPCQPLGNLFVQQGNARNARDSGLGSMAILPDELIVGIFSELEAMDLLRIQGVSHSFYAFTRLEGQWKHEFIKRNNGVLQGWKGSWRRTYLCQFCAKFSGAQRLPTDALRISDVYSDVLFTPHMAARYDPCLIVKSSRFSDNIPRVDGSTLDTADLGSEPLILTNLMEQWSALHGEKPWSLAELSRRYPQVAFRAEAVLARLSDYIPYHDQCQFDESPLYIFDADFVEKTEAASPGHSLLNDFAVPHLFEDDLFSVLGTMRPDHRWLIAGPARSGSTFHCDPNATSAWNAVVTGRKLWILFPPHVTPPGVMVSDDQAEVETPLSLAEWLANFYGTAKRQYGPNAKHPEYRNTMLEGICNAGEVFYVPSGWWHLVVNLEDSIAVTQNFVSRTNLKQVLDFLKHRAAQVSGFTTGSTERHGSCVDADESGGGSVSKLFKAALKRQRRDLYEATLEPPVSETPVISRAGSSSTSDRPSTNVWEGLKDSGESGSDVAFSFGFEVEEDEL